MKLKSIKAYGFKSFADKIEIEIKNNITAIVGPNGSGKSNIVDAVRWVLGEQSVKSLRGSGAMTDCIFQGSKTREPLKRAEVSLEFDNSDHELNSDLTEIEIKRVVYHTGENEYFLNNAKVRLKDITNLFLDSGAGIDSFHIISQGSIESVVNNKPEDRRIIFEEAAGVLKYKKRKEESLRKLEKTKDNLEKVGLITKELENTILPLKEQSENAKKYLEEKQKLEELEISFLAAGIQSKNQEYQTLKQEVESLENKVFQLKTSATEEGSSLELLRLENIKLEEAISQKNNELLKKTEILAEQNSEKDITLERQKYSVDKEKLNEGLISLKEETLKLEKDNELASLDLESSVKKQNKIKQDLQNIEENISINRLKQTNLTNQKNALLRDIWETKNQIEILENNILNDAKIPLAIKNVLNNPRLEGIHGTIGKLIHTEENYLNAIEVALGASGNFIVVENEENAKKAIQYLKENHLGRATFFPKNIIKGKYIEKETRNILKKEPGFLGVASDLITYDETYRNIMENILGNIIVVSNMEHMNHLGKKTNYRYRIVTLDGELLHTGGSMTGGSIKKSTSNLNDKIELEKLKTKQTEYQNRSQSLEESLQNITENLETYLNERIELEKKLVILEEEQKRKNARLEEIAYQLKEKQSELTGVENLLDNTLEQQVLKIIENIKNLEKEISLLKIDLSNLKEKREQILEKITNHEKANKEKNSTQSKLEQELKQKEINLGKLDIYLDNLLQNLSENYNMTYEKAIRDYPLEIEYETAKSMVDKLKQEIAALGTVNLGSIEEYERLNTRYIFLNTQKTDLEKSSQELKKVIEEMDEIMIQKFADTFESIKKEFTLVFKKLFKGGNGVLKLTNPENLLETGIEIIAEPPGKKLSNIALLSGGEKTLTAISLLFAILNVKPVPFCILDEVEAALDEANVDTFGSFLQSKKDKSEFILITHKKRTMEYADTLYGITMQESGVSKIVRVELDDYQEK